MRLLYASLAVFLMMTLAAQAQLRSGFPDAKPVPAYSAEERAAAFQQLLHLAAPLKLGAVVSVTPNAPFATDGTHLDFWKPSFVLGNERGGEMGVNFWGLHNDGHVNIGFKAGGAKSYALDCRMLSAGPITYKVFTGANTEPNPHGEAALVRNHLLLVVPTPAAGATMLVEMWPTPTTEVVGFLGCDLSPIAP